MTKQLANLLSHHQASSTIGGGVDNHYVTNNSHQSNKSVPTLAAKTPTIGHGHSSTFEIGDTDRNAKSILAGVGFSNNKVA